MSDAPNDTATIAALQRDVARLMKRVDRQKTAKGKKKKAKDFELKKRSVPVTKGTHGFNGYNLQLAMGLGQDKPQYNDIITAVHDACKKCGIDLVQKSWTRWGEVLRGRAILLVLQAYPWLEKFTDDYYIQQLAIQYSRSEGAKRRKNKVRGRTRVVDPDEADDKEEVNRSCSHTASPTPLARRSASPLPRRSASPSATPRSPLGEVPQSPQHPRTRRGGRPRSPAAAADPGAVTKAAARALKKKAPPAKPTRKKGPTAKKPAAGPSYAPAPSKSARGKGKKSKGKGRADPEDAEMMDGATTSDSQAGKALSKLGSDDEDDKNSESEG